MSNLLHIIGNAISSFSIFFLRPPKPHTFAGLNLQSSIGGFNLQYWLNLEEFINILGNILPLVLPIYLPLRHLVPQVVRLPSIGCSVNLSGEEGLNSDTIASNLDIMPNAFLLTDPVFRLYMDLLKFINNPLVNIILLGLFVLCLRRVGLLSARTNLFSVMSIFIFFSRGALSHSLIRNIVSQDNSRLIIYTFSSNVLFVLSNLLFDYLSVLHRVRGITFFNNIYLTHFIIGFAYLLNITLGVFGSNGTWYWGQHNHLNGGWSVIISTILSIVFPLMWFSIGNNNTNRRLDIWNSLARSLLEVFAFNSVAYCTYIYWGFWVSHVVYYPNIIAIAVFTVLYLFVSYITIYFETYGGMPLIYGISYWLMFACAAMLSNGIFSLITQHIIPSYIQVIIIVVLSLITILIYPNIYRGGVIMARSVLADAIFANNNLLNQEVGHNIYLIFWHLFIYLLLFNNFVFHTGFFFTYIVIWFNLTS